MQQHKHQGRCSSADPLASLLMRRVCFEAGNHLHKGPRSRTDAKTCACIVAVGATCRQMPHGFVTHMLPGSQHTSLQTEKKKKKTPEQLVYKSHSVREMHNNI